jgi:hypothetical protein
MLSYFVQTRKDDARFFLAPSNALRLGGEEWDVAQRLRLDAQKRSSNVVESETVRTDPRVWAS